MKRLHALRIANMQDVMEAFEGNSDDYYKSPFAILAELEKEIQFKEVLDATVLIPYKTGGDAIFEVERVYSLRGTKIAEYTFNSVIS